MNGADAADATSIGAFRTTVAVIGGGPAGASAALELARHGVDAVLVERSDGRGNPAGECLAPSATHLLRRLGLDDALRASGALPSYGNRSLWGGDGAAADRDFLRERHGHGWHLDRPAFNAALIDAAERSGVVVWRQSRVASLRRGGEGWTLDVASPQGAWTLAAEMLIDGSGRSAVVARGHAVRRRVFDQQVAATAILEQDPFAAPFDDATTLIEAAACGWWYAALLPARRLAVTWFTDPDLLAESAAWRPNVWWDLLHRTDLLWPALSPRGYAMPGAIQVLAAGSSLLSRLWGEGWVAAGDAAAAFDPLSSHGIGSALAGGARGAAAVVATLAGDDTACAAYADRVRAGYARYLWTRQSYYADEQRWPDARFWARRHAGSGYVAADRVATEARQDRVLPRHPSRTRHAVSLHPQGRGPVR